MTENKKVLKFNEDGTLKIMQITDIHGIYKKAPDTLRLIEKTLDIEKPDLIVFTGDQVKGYGLSFFTGNRKAKTYQTIKNYIEPIEKRNIPFLVCYGNHDTQVGMTFDEVFDIYKQYSTCVIPDEELRYDASTYAMPILNSKGTEPVFNIYMIFSGLSAKGGGYESVAPERIEWFRSARELLKEKYGRYIPSFVFQHIPVREIYRMFDEVPKNHPDAIRAFRTYKNKYYKLKDEFVIDGLKLYEPPAVSDINTGEFEAIKEKGDIIAMYFGHDHKNNFYGNVDGIDLGYSPACGFGEYGKGVSRGVRVFEFNENDIRNYKTYSHTYRSLFGKKVLKPFNNLFYNMIPTSKDAAKPLLLRAGGIIAAVSAVIALIVFLFAR